MFKHTHLLTCMLKMSTSYMLLAPAQSDTCDNVTLSQNTLSLICSLLKFAAESSALSYKENVKFQSMSFSEKTVGD